MPAVITKTATLVALVATAAAFNKRDFTVGEPLSAAEDIRHIEMSALVTDTSRFTAQNSTAKKVTHARADKPKRASPRLAPDAGSLAANIKREEDVLKTLSNTLDRYTVRSGAAKGLVDAKEKAEKAKDLADKHLADAEAEVQDAKMKVLEDIKPIEVSALVTDTSRFTAHNSTAKKVANATAEKPKRASPRPAPDAGSLAANIKREKDVLKTLSNTLDRYTARSGAAKVLVDAKEKAEKAKDLADKHLADAVAEVQDAKMKRLEAARVEAKSLGDDKSNHVFGGAEKNVISTERKLREANRVVRLANAEVRKTTSKADRVVESAAQIEEHVERGRQEVETLAEAIKKEQASYAVQEQKIASAAADLAKKETSALAAMNKADKASKATKAAGGNKAPKPTPKAT